MKEIVDRHNRRAPDSEQMRMATISSCSDCQTPVSGGELGHHVGVKVTPFDSYEEFFCSSQTSVHLVSALVTYSGQRIDVVKQGYLGKLERSHRRYFVLRAGSHTGPSRLEWYKSQEKFAAMEESSGKATLFGLSKQGFVVFVSFQGKVLHSTTHTRVIYLRCCISVGRLSTFRKGLTVALYAQDQTMVLVADNQQDQEAWYLSIKKMMEECRDEDQACDDDDGYCTLPPAAFFKEVWPVLVNPRGLGRSKSLAGELHLCLTATSLILFRVGAFTDFPSVTIPLLAVRRFGHLEGSFFLEVGRSAPVGPGELWFEARDQAQHIHEVVRDTVRALRALPDFNRSPTSNHNPFLVPKRCRPKYREKKKPNVQTGPTQFQEPNTTEPQSPISLHSTELPEPDRYMDMRKQPCAGECCEGEGVGYMMMMSPQVSRTSCVLPLDAYVTMSSPPKDLSASISPQGGVNRCSPLYPSHRQNKKGQLPQQFGSIHSTKGCADTSGPMMPFAQTAPLQSSPHSSHLQGEERFAIRSRLASCLPSCLIADD